MGIVRNGMVVFFSFLVLVAQAQVSFKKEASDRMRNLVQLIESGKPIYLKYSIYVEPVQLFDAISRPAYTQKIEYFKSGNTIRIIMPDSIEVITSGYLGVMVDHKNKEITVGRDTLKKGENPLSIFPMLADSAKEVKKLNEGEYLILFHDEIIYKQLRLGFDPKTNLLKYLEVEMNEDESYKKIRVNYELWDIKWKPNKGFPNQDKYIVEKGKHFASTSAYSIYKFIDTTLSQQAITY